MSADQESEYLSLKEFAARSPLSESTVRRRLRDGIIPYKQPAGLGTLILIRKSVLDDLPVTDVERLQQNSESVSNEESRTDPPNCKPLEDIESRLPGPTPKWKTE